MCVTRFHIPLQDYNFHKNTIGTSLTGEKLQHICTFQVPKRPNWTHILLRMRDSHSCFYKTQGLLSNSLMKINSEYNIKTEESFGKMTMVFHLSTGILVQLFNFLGGGGPMSPESGLRLIPKKCSTWTNMATELVFFSFFFFFIDIGRSRAWTWDFPQLTPALYQWARLHWGNSVSRWRTLNANTDLMLSKSVNKNSYRINLINICCGDSSQ